MSKFGDSYVLESGRAGHARLRMISEIHDGRTRQLLTQAGLGPGHRYVEFGCGLGYVTRWAATQGAHALGIDLSQDQVAAATELAQEAAIANAEFRSASVYDPGLEPDTFDVSYSRWLLVHLQQPVDAMRSIYRALKPGGVMVCEEADISVIYAEPHSAAYQDFVGIALAGGGQRGVDYSGGRRAHVWAKLAGFDVLHSDAYQPHYLAGPHKGFWNWTLQEAGAGLVKEGLLPQARLDELAAGMTAADEDPGTLVAHCRMHQLIARKPL